MFAQVYICAKDMQMQACFVDDVWKPHIVGGYVWYGVHSAQPMGWAPSTELQRPWKAGENEPLRTADKHKSLLTSSHLDLDKGSD